MLVFYIMDFAVVEGLGSRGWDVERDVSCSDIAGKVRRPETFCLGQEMLEKGLQVSAMSALFLSW